LEISGDALALRSFHFYISFSQKIARHLIGITTIYHDLPDAGVYYHLRAYYAGLRRGIETRSFQTRAVKGGLKKGVLFGMEAPTELVPFA
jgi:hypothetical protein